MTEGHRLRASGGYASIVTDGADLVPEFDFARIRWYWAGRNPADVAQLIRLEIDVDEASTILQDRPSAETAGQETAGTDTLPALMAAT